MGGFFESIRVENGQAARLPYHQARVDRTVSDCGGKPGVLLELARLPILSQLPPRSLYKLRVDYSIESIQSAQLTAYEPLIIKRIGIVELPQGLEYSYKWTDRRALHQLLEARPGYDELLLTRNGILTDSIIGNVALEIDGRWRTPAQPLLPGTYRQFLLDNGNLELADLTVDDVLRADRIAIINAMRGLELAIPSADLVVMINS